MKNTKVILMKMEDMVEVNIFLIMEIGFRHSFKTIK